MRQKLMLAVAAGVGSVGLFGAAALGAFGTDASTTVVSAIAPAASAVMGEDKGGDRLKQLLDGLVLKSVITQQQEDAILAAAKDAATAKVRTAKVVRDLLGDMFQTARDYLGGVTLKDVTTAMRSGKSLGDIAKDQGKSRDGLVQALTTAANTRIDKAVADNKLTVEQAATLKTKVAAEIATFVDRKAPLKATTGTETTTEAP